MPIFTKNLLAMRLQQNWVTRNPYFEQMPTAKDALDDSLTSLNWLHNLNMNIGRPTPPVSPAASPDSHCYTTVETNRVLGVNHMQGFQDGDHRSLSSNYQTPLHLDTTDYATNPYIKPPYSYATLICMAMQASKKQKITLAAIYAWITENFMYYRMADPSWQNSIRHNLSLNKCFQKVARRKDEPGKGGFWQMNPDYYDIVDSGTFKKRKDPNSPESPALPKKRSMDYDDILSKKRGRRILDETMQATLSLEENLTCSYLKQDILVSGLKLKTEDILDIHNSDAAAELLVTLSPPSSDDSDDFNDLLGTDLSELRNDIESDKVDPLDLTINGIKIEPPEWWSDSFTGAGIRGLFSESQNTAHSGTYNTASHNTTSHNLLNVNRHPWLASKSDIDDAIAALDEVVFDPETIPNPIN